MSFLGGDVSASAEQRVDSDQREGNPIAGCAEGTCPSLFFSFKEQWMIWGKRLLKKIEY
jgi:hypothetical protein